MGGTATKEEAYYHYKNAKDAGDNPGVSAFQDEFDKRYSDEKQQKEDTRFSHLSDQTKKYRDQDLAEGRARGEKEFADESLGRVDANRSAEIGDLIAQRKARLSGYSPEEENALHDQATNELNRNTQTTVRQLRGVLNQSGVKGGAAGAQVAKVYSDADRVKGGLERDLYVQKIAERKGALDSLEKTLGTAKSDELERQKYNISQQNKEKFGRLGTEFGYASLGSGERASIMQRIIGEDAADASQKVAAHSGKK
jgi:hypothetical protein